MSNPDESLYECEKDLAAANARAAAAERDLTALQASYTRGSAESEAAALRLALDLARNTANEETARADALRAELDQLARDVGQALCAMTLALGEKLSAPSEHAIVKGVLELRAELEAERDTRVKLLAERADLHAEVERLRDTDSETEALRFRALFEEQRLERQYAESRLAAATKLLGRIVKYAQEDNARTPGSTRLARALGEAERLLANAPADPPRNELEAMVQERATDAPSAFHSRPDSDSFIPDAPAAPGKGAECEHCGWAHEPEQPPCKPTRTDHERAVLKAMAAVPEETLRRSLENTLHSDEHSRAPARAELARREAEKPLALEDALARAAKIKETEK